MNKRLIGCRIVDVCDSKELLIKTNKGVMMEKDVLQEIMKHDEEAIIKLMKERNILVLTVIVLFLLLLIAVAFI